MRGSVMFQQKEHCHDVLKSMGHGDMGVRGEERDPGLVQWLLAGNCTSTALPGYQCLSSIGGQSPPIAFVVASSKIPHENFISSI